MRYTVDRKCLSPQFVYNICKYDLYNILSTKTMLFHVWWYIALPPIGFLISKKSLSRVQLFATPWTVASQTPPSMGFSRQEYWSGLPFPSPGDLPNPGIETGSPAS